MNEPPAGAIADVLARAPLFRSLERPVVEQLAAGCRRVGLKRGDVLFAMGAVARAFYVVETGGVRVFRVTSDGREQVIHQLKSGQSFAEAAVFNFGRYPVHAQARATPTSLIEVRGEHFLRVLGERPAIGAAMIGALCQRLREMVDRVEDLAAADAGARLARWLLRLPARSTADGTLTVTRPVAKKDLAAELALRPETLSRLLKRWRTRGVIAERGREWTLRDVAELERVADRGVSKEPAVGPGTTD